MKCSSSSRVRTNKMYFLDNICLLPLHGCRQKNKKTKRTKKYLLYYNNSKETGTRGSVTNTIPQPTRNKHVLSCCASARPKRVKTQPIKRTAGRSSSIFITRLPLPSSAHPSSFLSPQQSTSWSVYGGGCDSTWRHFFHLRSIIIAHQGRIDKYSGQNLARNTDLSHTTRTIAALSAIARHTTPQ